MLCLRLHGRQRDFGLGGYPEVGLAAARLKAREARTVIDAGLDPTLERQRGHRQAREAASGARSFRAVARSGEVREMRWEEVDLVRATWTVPAERMTAQRLHRVPLAPEAVRLLEAMPTSPAGRKGLVFPGVRTGRPLSDMALSMLVRALAKDGLAEGEAPRWRDPDGRVVVPHGFRTSFRGWTRARGWPDHLGEIALAHVDRDRVRAAYARDDLMEERRPIMIAWTECCCRADRLT